MTLADEDTNSILTDNANRAIQGNVAMQVAPPGDQIWIKCKWRHRMTKFGSNVSGATFRRHFVTCVSGSFWWQDFRILTKFQDFDQISGFQPNFKISTKYQDLNLMSEFDQISGF